ncbi:unnamed protein product [Gongylonema pulchrum]|uniref:Transcription factor n=1 Tax=Gongylonema pulchrum TaxID=637853 RepID=A0A183E6G8_9BILA|nr:unnamed protein product [Gongylonema pulchrum]
MPFACENWDLTDVFRISREASKRRFQFPAACLENLSVQLEQFEQKKSQFDDFVASMKKLHEEDEHE